jgi:hypothetical protein
MKEEDRGSPVITKGRVKQRPDFHFEKSFFNFVDGGWASEIRRRER